MPDPTHDLVTVEIQVDPPFAAHVNVDRIDAATRRTLAVAGVDGAVEVSIVVTSDEAVQALNRTYRGQDKVTDVLSFSQGDDGPPLPPDLPRLLGDVIIAYPQVIVQAARAGWGTDDELEWLIIHGLLHLLGYEDEDEDGRIAMWALGEQILGRRAPGGPADD